MLGSYSRCCNRLCGSRNGFRYATYVGFYVNSPERAMVLPVDEKS